MTRIVASVLADTPDELERLARLAAKEADIVEIRLDGPSGLPWDLRPYFQLLDKPTIATVRHADEGGRSHADDKTRADILRRAMRAGATYMDVEAWHEDLSRLVADAHAMGGRVIISRHDVSGTPTAAELVDDIRALRAAGADVVKLATRMESPEDAAALVEAALVARQEGIPLALMAVNDPFLRLFAPSLGLALAYGRVGDGPAAAPGQVAVAKLRDIHEDLTRADRGPQRGTTRLALLIGHPVAHSKSPALQNAAFAAARIDAVYTALDITADALGPFLAGLKSTNALGLNVTVPHKRDVMPHLDALDASAESAGAVNAIQLSEGKLIGHNTDGAGALDALVDAGATLKGARMLVLGAGGTARAVAASAVAAGARVTIANRTPAHAEELAQAIGAATVPWTEVDKAASEADILVHATTLGMLDARLPVDVARLPETAVVLDCVYRSGGTPLASAARSRGLRVAEGESMLLHQGARAFEVWTGQKAPLAAMRAALADAQERVK